MSREVLRTQAEVENLYLFKRIRKLIPVKYEGKNQIGRHKLLCVCDCGNVTVTLLRYLKDGRTSSCGCHMKKRVSETQTKHRLTNHPLYKTHANMLHRCRNPKNEKYENYGGRGIEVCDEWESLVVFVHWAESSGWKPGLKIDRTNNDGNYEPTNCRWTTVASNNRNKRTNRYCLVDGVKMCDTDGSIVLGMSPSYVESIRRGRIKNTTYADRLQLLSP